MQLLTRAITVVGIVALVAPIIGCGGKKQVKLEMTREEVLHNPTISSLALDPSGRLDTRERGFSVTVTMTGDPGLQATFDLDGRFQGRAMEEVQPGVYSGTFDVAQGDTGELWTVGHLAHPPTGASQRYRAGSPLALFKSVPLPPPATCTPAMIESFDAALRRLTTYFAFDKYELSDEAQELLSDNRQVLESHPLCSIFVLGHADDIGDAHYNEILSMHRAFAVGSYLESLGIPAQRLQKLYFGESQPAVPGDSPEDRARNRRVELRALDPY